MSRLYVIGEDYSDMSNRHLVAVLKEDVGSLQPLFEVREENVSEVMAFLEEKGVTTYFGLFDLSSEDSTTLKKLLEKQKPVTLKRTFPPSSKQQKLIWFIERNTHLKFTGTTSAEAYEFIGKYHSTADLEYQSKVSEMYAEQF